MKKLSILGSTGSIGRNTLEIVKRFPDLFSVQALTAKSNVELLADQILAFDPELAVVFESKDASDLKRRIAGRTRTEVLYGSDGYLSAARIHSADMVVSAMVGAAGLLPTMAAVLAGKDVALANKETLVMAGHIVMEQAEKSSVKILPVDSEHSAIFQCLQGHRKDDLDQILLTASGGPFLSRPGDTFNEIRAEDALKHPTWQMGSKITIDSATLMNKGLEVIEAKWLFDVSLDDIHIVVHPQSIIHSMVAFRDGSILAQAGVPDMKGAIAYALSYPERLPLQQPLPDFASIGSLTFHEPDTGKFPCLFLAYEACSVGGTLPAVLNAANEVAVNAFIIDRIRFTDIPSIIKDTMDAHCITRNPDLYDVLEADRWARQSAREKIEKEFLL